MNVINLSLSGISKKEINNCINLLPEKYKNIDIKIIIFSSKFQVLLYNLFTGRKTTKHSIGDFNSYHNSIRCYKHKMPKDNNIKIRIVDVLMHELRHKIQTLNYPDKYAKDNKNYIPFGDGYGEQWIEIDANRFSRRILNMNKSAISQILNIEATWNIDK